MRRCYHRSLKSLLLRRPFQFENPRCSNPRSSNGSFGSRGKKLNSPACNATSCARIAALTSIASGRRHESSVRLEGAENIEAKEGEGFLDERHGGQRKAGRGRRSEEIRALEQSRRKGSEASKQARKRRLQPLCLCRRALKLHDER